MPDSSPHSDPEVMGRFRRFLVRADAPVFVEALDGLVEQLETAEARANAAEAFIVRMDMAYRYEEFRLADPNPAKRPT